MKTWNIIKGQLVNVMNDLSNGNFDKGLMDGTIVLVKDETIKSYRPISLLNFDYKLFTRLMKFRQDEIVPLIINKNQTACNSTKNITSALCKIRDKISEMRYLRKKVLLISFDFDHAFDRVNHHFLIDLLSKLNFNTNFIEVLSS
jgi:hypothetical protein